MLRTVMALALLTLAAFPALAQDKAKESLYDRVMRTGTLRCGYVLIPPMVLSRNPNTGVFSGLAYDTMGELGKILGLKVEWAEEVTFATMVEALESNRVDLLCHGDWPNAERNRRVDFADPFFYVGLGAWVRADDARFDGDIAKFNDPAVRVAAIDGEMGETVARNRFPQAQIVSSPNTTDIQQLFMDVDTNKADVAFSPNFLAGAYLKAHPGALKNVAVATPVLVNPTALVFRQNEYAFQNMLNEGVRELILKGYMDRILSQYAKPEDGWYIVAQPYQVLK